MPSLQSKIVRTWMRVSDPFRSQLTSNNLTEKRAAHERLEKFFPLDPSTTIQPYTGTGFTGEWIRTPEARKDYVMLYMAGGGFIYDSSGLHRDMISRIGRGGRLTAFSLRYSLAPEHPFPTAVHEALAAYTWLLQHYKPQHIVLAGDSAGGSLVLSLLHLIAEGGLPNPACAIAISPATDATLASELKKADDVLINRNNLEFFIDAYFQDTPRNDPIASPLFGSFEGFPPLLLHVAKGERMYGDTIAVERKAKTAKVDVRLYDPSGLWHVWHLFARRVPEARAAIEDIGTFIRHYT
jgi:epsilon-lactone hydrolase